MVNGHGWAQANTDAKNNPELHQPGGAYRQLKHRAIGSLIPLLILVGVVIVLGFAVG